MDNENIFTVSSDYEIATIFANGTLDTLSIMCNNTEAVDIFGQYIKIMEYFNENGINSIEEVVIARHIYTNLVFLLGEDIGLKIPQYTFFMSYSFDYDELRLCEEWLVKHKDKICWYEEKNILYIKNR